MAKTVTIRMEEEYTSKGKTITVEEALAWAEKHETVTGEDGESEEPKFTPGQLICYAVNRLKALHKDNKRYEKGVLASRLYAPRIEKLEDKPRGLAPVVETVHEIGERLAPKEAKEPKPKKPAKPKAPARKRTPKASKPAVEQGNPTVGDAL